VLSPHHKLSLSANYTLPLDESIGKITIGATFTHTSKTRTNYADRDFMVAGVYVDGPTGPVLTHDDLGLQRATTCST